MIAKKKQQRRCRVPPIPIAVMPDFVLKEGVGKDNFIRDKINIDYLVGHLHGRHDIQHIGGLADLLSLQKMKWMIFFKSDAVWKSS